jgi:hypothetical protein
MNIVHDVNGIFHNLLDYHPRVTSSITQIIIPNSSFFFNNGKRGRVKGTRQLLSEKNKIKSD